MSAGSPANKRVAIAISAFRADSAVIQLVDRILGEDWPADEILIVDSLGSGAIPAYLRSSGRDARVRYVNSEINLGSAGNLQKRLELSASFGMNFVLALNHDALMTRSAFEALLRHANLEKVGALYPLRFLEGKGIFDLSGTAEFSFRARGTAARPVEELTSVHWGSSNGALYSLEPLVQDALKPDGTLWMGWEDYLYGVQLRKHGYHQYIVSSAYVADQYEYRPVSRFGITLTMADKPAWYLYYASRNLLLINLYEHPSFGRTSKTLAWVALLLVHAVASRAHAHQRSGLVAYAAGVRDGLRNRRGKWVDP